MSNLDPALRNPDPLQRALYLLYGPEGTPGGVEHALTQMEVSKRAYEAVKKVGALPKQTPETSEMIEPEDAIVDAVLDTAGVGAMRTEGQSINSSSHEVVRLGAVQLLALDMWPENRRKSLVRILNPEPLNQRSRDFANHTGRILERRVIDQDGLLYINDEQVLLTSIGRYARNLLACGYMSPPVSLRQAVDRLEATSPNDLYKLTDVDLDNLHAEMVELKRQGRVMYDINKRNNLVEIPALIHDMRVSPTPLGWD